MSHSVCGGGGEGVRKVPKSDPYYLNNLSSRVARIHKKSQIQKISITKIQITNIK